MSIVRCHILPNSLNVRNESFWKTMWTSFDKNAVRLAMPVGNCITTATQNYGNLSNETRKLLVRCLDPTDELLFQLSLDSRLENDIKEVEAMRTVEEKNNRLLKAFCRVPEQDRASVYKLFEDSLCDTKQSHVADVLHGVTTTIMSQEHHDLLTKHVRNLRRFISARSELVEILLSEGVLSSHDENVIFTKETDSDIAGAIVKILQRKPDSSFDIFVEALNKSGQDHVAYILTGEGSVPMKEEFLTHLNNSRGLIVSNMESKTGSLVSHLVSAGVLTDTDRQRVMAKDTNVRRNELILDILLRKSQRAYEDFAKTLRACDQEHLAVILEGHQFQGSVDLDIDEELISGMSVEENRRSLENDFRDRLCIELVEDREFARSGSDLHGCGSESETVSQCLMTNGIVPQSVHVGSIHIRFRCLGLESFENFRRLHDNGTLDAILTAQYCPLYADRGLKKIKLVVPGEQLDRCGDEFHRDRDALMTAEHREALQLASESKEVIDKTNVVDVLLDRLELCKHTKEFIREMNDRREKVRTLFDVVSRRPDVVYDQLITALKITGQHEVTHLIKYLQRQRQSNVSHPVAVGKRRPNTHRNDSMFNTSHDPVVRSTTPSPVPRRCSEASLSNWLQTVEGAGENIDWKTRCEELIKMIADLEMELKQRQLADLRLALAGQTASRMIPFVSRANRVTDGACSESEHDNDCEDFSDYEVNSININAASTGILPCSVEARRSGTSSEKSFYSMPGTPGV